jgi:hypothetical protein
LKSLEEKMNALIRERSEKDKLYRETDAKFNNLSRAKADLDEYLRQERDSQAQERRQKNDDLE